MSAPDLGLERIAMAEAWAHFQKAAVAKRIAQMARPDEDWYVRTMIAIEDGAMLYRSLGVRPKDVL